MAERVRAFAVTVAANTVRTAPAETAMALPRGIIERVEIIIPDGHVGITGIAIAYAHQRVYPEIDNTWLQANDDKFTFEPDPKLSSGAWSAFAFNEDVFQHTFYVRFVVGPPEGVDTAAMSAVFPRSIPAAQLAGTAG